MKTLLITVLAISLGACTMPQPTTCQINSPLWDLGCDKGDGKGPQEAAVGSTEGRSAPDTPDTPNDKPSKDKGKDKGKGKGKDKGKDNASEHNGKGGNDGKGGKDRDGGKNSDKGKKK